jgi:hypothetical protein
LPNSTAATDPTNTKKPKTILFIKTLAHFFYYPNICLHPL